MCVGILKIDKVLRSSVTSEATEDRIDRVGKILKKLCLGFVAAFREEASLGFYTSPWFSVAATAKRLEKVGPGHSIVTEIPVAIFSVLNDSK